MVKKGIISSLLLLSILTLVPWGATGVFAQRETWSKPVIISHTPNASWFPDLAVDSFGNVHVIWCETTPVGDGHNEQVYYSMWDGQTWSEPSDIIPPSHDITRNAIAADQRGNLHMLVGGSPGSRLGAISTGSRTRYWKTLARNARTASSWSTLHQLSQGDSYMGDIAVDSKDVIHVIYDDIICAETGLERCYADIFYRRSPDGGQTWTYPVNLFRSPATGSSHSQMEIDNNDTIHVVWDEGWDRITGDGNPLFSCYTFSTDGGETWAPVIYLTYPQAPTQITVGANGHGGVMLVWRTNSRAEFFYQWSADGGRSWTPPQVVPKIWARPPYQELHFDMYDMAADSTGQIHLLVVGRESPLESAPLGVYHLTWDGEGWSEAEKIFSDAKLYPEYTKILIDREGRLHAVWFTYGGLEEDDIRKVWYSTSQVAGLPQALATPTSSPTPTISTPTQTPTLTPKPRPTATPYPTLLPGTPVLPEELYTEYDDVLRLMLSLSPVAFLALLIAATRLRRFRR